MGSQSTTDNKLTWFAWKLVFRAHLLLWLLMAVILFQHRAFISYEFTLNSSSSSEQQQQQQRQLDAVSNSSSDEQQQHDPFDKSDSSEQLPPPQSPSMTRTSPSKFISEVRLAELTLRVGQEEQQLRRLPDPKDDEIPWRRRMLKGSGTPSSPSDMNHASKS